MLLNHTHEKTTRPVEVALTPWHPYWSLLIRILKNPQTYLHDCWLNSDISLLWMEKSLLTYFPSMILVKSNFDLWHPIPMTVSRNMWMGQRNPNQQLIDGPAKSHYFVWASTILLVVQGFATTHSIKKPWVFPHLRLTASDIFHRGQVTSRLPAAASGPDSLPQCPQFLRFELEKSTRKKSTNMVV